jgi:hypothetical protein
MSMSSAFSSSFDVNAANDQPPTLLESMLGTVGQDPSFLGATGYLDGVFTSRLMSDTE